MKKIPFIFIAFFMAELSVFPFSKTALDEYVSRKDPAYGWHVVASEARQDCHIHALRLTSQTWRQANEISDPVWQHWLRIIVPKNCKSNVILFYISNGNREEQQALGPEHPEPGLIRIALNTNSIVVELRNVPNQPLSYFEEKKFREEDDLLSHSWMQAMQSKDPTWSIRFPMVKAVIRGMDCAESFLRTKNIQTRGFVVSGASKRGWTAWLVAALDQRVIGVIPMVIDILNGKQFLEAHLTAYGEWSEFLQDYKNNGVLDRYRSPEFEWLMSFEDPFVYRDRLIQPKFIVSASGDELFFIDASRNFFSALPSEKYLRIIPNASHTFQHLDPYEYLESFFDQIVYREKRPRFSWEIDKDGAMIVDCVDQPSKVLVWTAYNPRSRDFRVTTIGTNGFVAHAIDPVKPGQYRYIPSTEPGFHAAFFELTFDLPQNGRSKGLPVIFTTEASVTRSEKLEKTVYDFVVKDMKGKDVSLSQYKGKTLLIVNVASKCGLTPQYEGLEKLQKNLGPKGLQILGFPCNQFGMQEPGTHEEIAKFCDINYKITFPLFAKIDVNGENADPLYKYLAEKAPGILGTLALKWNFTKFLVDSKGNVITRFAPTDTPEAIEAEITKHLPR